MSKGGVSLKKKGESRKAEVKSFTKPKSTMMIARKTENSEAGEVDKGEKGLLDSIRKS